MSDRITTYCSFCGRSEREVLKMVASHESGSIICDECIDICAGLVAPLRREMVAADVGLPAEQEAA